MGTEKNLPAGANCDDSEFYVEPECCMSCGVPEDIAPEIFVTGEKNCAIRRQPCSQDEVNRTIRAMWSSEVDCVRYGGRDVQLLDRLARAGLADQADYPLKPDTPARLRDRVTFECSAADDFPNSALLIAKAFRADLRAKGNKVLPALFDRRAVWVSWYKNRFHLIRFIDAGEGKIVAHLRSSFALQGLAWLLDDWLHAQSVTGILWEASGDTASKSPTPM